ncbi:MAG: ecotin family protein [Betaproteobacteria bacterium]
MTRFALSWAAVAAFAATSALAQSADLKPFPPPAAGQQRFAIRVPALADEDARRVQVLVGKTVEVDCNRMMFGAPVERRTAQGWGFDYYVVGPFGQAASTMMACPPDAPKRREFVAAHTPELEWLRYNSKLPLVIYAPTGAEVRYRIWSAGPPSVAVAE